MVLEREGTTDWIGIEIEKKLSSVRNTSDCDERVN